MISDMIRFVQNEEGQLQLGANWDLSTGNSDSNRTCLILVSPREVNAWNTFIAELSTKNGIQGLNSTTIEFPRIGTFSQVRHRTKLFQEISLQVASS